MQSGRLRHRGQIQSRTVTRENGEDVVAWATVATRWMEIKPLSGREYLQSQQVQASSSVRIIIRAYPDLTVEHRITHGGRVYDINHINNIDERNIAMELMCSEAA